MNINENEQSARSLNLRYANQVLSDQNSEERCLEDLPLDVNGFGKHDLFEAMQGEEEMKIEEPVEDEEYMLE